MQEVVFRRRLQIRWVSAIADIILSGMVIGPLVAPFLAASSLPILSVIGNIIYFMGAHVCPQPDMGVVLAPPFMMAVCMRCYGTVTGLLITRLLYEVTKGKGFYWLNQYSWSGVAVSSVLMMAYPLELAAEVLGWWSFNNYVVTLFGLITGLAWGLFTMPILQKWGKQGKSSSLPFARGG
ncbi:DUF2085 domain-containing protein [Aetokthonos hydrillicola Thurmond2011]|jgi:uncharacterized membrane protein|uniref:DUF2085 domain-containing protein n=1 Tax=Aetokthonos hydrillicola Thurmond2011 TaxID=2712845 RepID=A0AAP5M6L5_9CYAN|nr:DUF2085 domain-containing protein [Aetokthonos hydrillicola]MBO3457767.1 DUF2085 domain-containing protein [Aetokthonos hydrillicola CCALA 1050]MBW4589382.1 DUF2085 domain-containing protein [Aetokthonos hydrillicola CCALA 1050]MDR9897141.1 DUF2085 domain-containing protein [Aetokthonos hydrillicola Thurmond2011]